MFHTNFLDSYIDVVIIIKWLKCNSQKYGIFIMEMFHVVLFIKNIVLLFLLNYVIFTL